MRTYLMAVGVSLALFLGACAGEGDDPGTMDGPTGDATPPAMDAKTDTMKPADGALTMCPAPSWETCPDPTDTTAGTARTMTQVSFGMPYECADGSGRHCVKCATAVTTSTVGTSTQMTEFVPLMGCVLKDPTITDRSATPAVTYDGPFYCVPGSASAPGSTCH